MKSVESGWRTISAADDGLEQLCAIVNDNIRLQVQMKIYLPGFTLLLLIVLQAWVVFSRYNHARFVRWTLFGCISPNFLMVHKLFDPALHALANNTSSGKYIQGRKTHFGSV